MTIVGIDTAISNTGMAVIDSLSGIPIALYKPIPKHDASNYRHQWEKLDKILNVFESVLDTYQVYFVGFEDYVVGGNQRATTAVTAELVGALRRICVSRGIGCCRVHASKTLKFVRKARKVTKTEIRNYARDYLGLSKNVLKQCKIAPSDESDIADALVIANIARLVSRVNALASRKNYTLIEAMRELSVADAWESRWKELLFYTGSGILEKSGLAWLPKVSPDKFIGRKNEI